MSHLEVHQFMCREDNYGVLVHDQQSGATMTIDAPDASVVVRELKRRGWQLTHILVTHKHEDHVAGNLELKHEFGCKIIGPEIEQADIPGIQQTVKGGDTFSVGTRKINVFACPGHSAGHVAYHFPDGRIFEGTPAQMYQSVNQFRALHAITSVYCGHEYTLSNAHFAVAMEPGNRDLMRRFTEVRSLREKGQMTCPTTIGDELKTNPYLRCNSAEIRKKLAMEAATDIEVFAELRERKNNFKAA
jgi:hydroxyacylglutathione hydrolase